MLNCSKQMSAILCNKRPAKILVNDILNCTVTLHRDLDQHITNSFSFVLSQDNNTESKLIHTHSIFVDMIVLNSP